MERAAKADFWESEVWEINEESAWDRFQASSSFSKVVFNAFSFVFLTWEANGSRLCVYSPFTPAQCHLPPAGFQGICSFRFQPCSLHRFPLISSSLPHCSCDQQRSTWPHYPHPHPHPLWELNIELTSSLKVGILLLGTWCYFFFLPDF